MKVDPDDLVDSNEAAEILGLYSGRAISIYRKRYADFPAPVVTKSSGKWVLFLRDDIAAWKRGRARRRAAGRR